MIIYVYFDHDNESLKLGSLFVSQEKGFPIYSFQYSDEFLASKYAFLFVDGNLSPYQERQYLPIDKSIFPFITDSMPDRWGRKLLLKEEATKANKENRKARRLTKEKANAIIKEIKDVVNTNWKRLANQYQIDNDNIKEMEKCFSNCDI